MSKVEGGFTVYEHLSTMQKKTGKPFPQLISPLTNIDSPYILAVYEHYLEIVGLRQRDANGNIIPLSWNEIQAYCQLNNYTFTNWELTLFRNLDKQTIREA